MPHVGYVSFLLDRAISFLVCASYFTAAPTSLVPMFFSSQPAQITRRWWTATKNIVTKLRTTPILNDLIDSPSPDDFIDRFEHYGFIWFKVKGCKRFTGMPTGTQILDFVKDQSSARERSCTIENPQQRYHECVCDVSNHSRKPEWLHWNKHLRLCINNRTLETRAISSTRWKRLHWYPRQIKQ